MNYQFKLLNLRQMQNFIDNVTVIFNNELKSTLSSSGRLSIDATSYSIYAYETLKIGLENTDEATTIGIAKLKPYYFIMRDTSLATDNFEQLWNAYNKGTIRKVL